MEINLNFFIRYGQPDPKLERDFDLSIKLRMSSVRYVHTNRFQTETVAFAQHFNQLQEVLGTMRAASDGIQVGKYNLLATLAKLNWKPPEKRIVHKEVLSWDLKSEPRFSSLVIRFGEK